MSSVRLRPALSADLELLRYWDQQPHVIESDPNDDWQWEQELGRDLDWRQQYIAELDTGPIGFLQIMDPYRDDEQYWGMVTDDLRAIDIWIGVANELGKGYGTQMMNQAIQLCFAEQSVQGILLDPLTSNHKAHRFYQRLGFCRIERRQFGLDDCYVYRLERGDWTP